MIFALLYLGLSADPFFFLRPGYKYPQINENPQYSYYTPMKNNCRIIKDTSGSFFKNDKYTCN